MIDGYEKHTCTECETMFTSNEELQQHHTIDHGLIIENSIQWTDVQPEDKVEETDNGFISNGKKITFSDEDKSIAESYLTETAKLQRVMVASEQRLKLARDEIKASEAETNAFYEQFLGESNGQDFSSGAGTIKPLDTPKFKYSKNNKLADTINTKGYNPNPNAGLYDNKEFKEGGDHLEDPLAKEDFEVSFYGKESIARENNLYQSPDGNWNESWQDEYWTHRLITAMRDNNGYEQIMDDIMEEMESDPNHADYFNKKLEYVKDAERSRPMHLFGIGESKASEDYEEDKKIIDKLLKKNGSVSFDDFLAQHGDYPQSLRKSKRYQEESKASGTCPNCGSDKTGSVADKWGYISGWQDNYCDNCGKHFNADGTPMGESKANEDDEYEYGFIPKVSGFGEDKDKNLPIKDHTHNFTSGYQHSNGIDYIWQCSDSGCGATKNQDLYMESKASEFKFGEYEVKCDCDKDPDCKTCGGKGTNTWSSTVGKSDESLKADWDDSGYEEKYSWLKDLGVEDAFKYANMTLYELPEPVWKIVNEDYVQGFKQMTGESYQPDQKDVVETSEEKIISRKLDNVPVGQIARELVLWDNMSAEEAEKMVSETEPNDNDITAQSLFNKKYSELNNNELAEMELYDV